MPDPKEAERLRRLREQQLRARDPHTKQRKTQRTITRKYRARKQVTFKEMLGDIPHKWRGLFIGFVLGLIIWIVLSSLFQELWADLAGLLVTAFFCVMGIFIGSGFDTRDKLRDI